MTVRQRMLAMRLLERQEKMPEYFKKLEIDVNLNKVESTEKERSTKVV